MANVSPLGKLFNRSRSPKIDSPNQQKMIMPIIAITYKFFYLFAVGCFNAKYGAPNFPIGFNFIYPINSVSPEATHNPL
jgi:hypothetical protein